MTKPFKAFIVANISLLYSLVYNQMDGILRLKL